MDRPEHRLAAVPPPGARRTSAWWWPRTTTRRRLAVLLDALADRRFPPTAGGLVVVQQHDEATAARRIDAHPLAAAALVPGVPWRARLPATRPCSATSAGGTPPGDARRVHRRRLPPRARVGWSGSSPRAEGRPGARSSRARRGRTPRDAHHWGTPHVRTLAVDPPGADYAEPGTSSTSVRCSTGSAVSTNAWVTGGGRRPRPARAVGRRGPRPAPGRGRSTTPSSPLTHGERHPREREVGAPRAARPGAPGLRADMPGRSSGSRSTCHAARPRSWRCSARGAGRGCSSAFFVLPDRAPALWGGKRVHAGGVAGTAAPMPVFWLRGSWAEIRTVRAGRFFFRPRREAGDKPLGEQFRQPSSPA